MGWSRSRLCFWASLAGAPLSRRVLLAACSRVAEWPLFSPVTPPIWPCLVASAFRSSRQTSSAVLCKCNPLLLATHCASTSSRCVILSSTLQSYQACLFLLFFETSSFFHEPLLRLHKTFLFCLFRLFFFFFVFSQILFAMYLRLFRKTDSHFSLLERVEQRHALLWLSGSQARCCRAGTGLRARVAHRAREKQHPSVGKTCSAPQADDWSHRNRLCRPDKGKHVRANVRAEK